MSENTVTARPEEDALSHREKLRRLREILFANIVLTAEIPSPTGAERRLTRFLTDRFTEAGLANISLDQAGNIAGVLPGRSGTRNLLVVAHLDKIWAETDDHTVSVGVGMMSGRGLADNSLGVAILATLPIILEELDLDLDANLVLLGTTRSFGRGDLAGMRFFLENSERALDAALVLEGIDLGRLSHSSLGMARGEIAVGNPRGAVPDGPDAGVVATIHALLGDLLAIDAREAPEARIRIGSFEAGSDYSTAPHAGLIRFEIHSQDAEQVGRIEEKIAKLVERYQGDAILTRLEMIAHRRPGNLGEDHPLVRRTRGIHARLGIESRMTPSVSELALLLDRGIPALTLGITRGEGRHTAGESIALEPLFDGLAQIVAVLQVMDETPAP